MALSLKPVAVCISDSAEFHFYSKGILEGEHCGIDNDHCIVAVGLKIFYINLKVMGLRMVKTTGF